MGKLNWGNKHATNNFAERAIRLMAMARKTWGGNRTANGARTQVIEGIPGRNRSIGSSLEQ